MISAPPPALPVPTELTQQVDVGGRRLAMTCSGAGPLTVLLETGLGAEADEWAVVQGEVARVARVCRYDRASRGKSDPAPKPRNAAQMVDDLDTLLRLTHTAGPYIVVGHSYGGLLMRLFAARHRSDVKGLVLVDSLQAEQFNVFSEGFPPPSPGEPPALAGIRAFWTGGWRSPASTVEGIDMPTSLDQDRAVGSLGDLRIRVIHADTFLHNEAAPAAFRPMLQAKWNDLQRRFAALSTRVTFRHAAASSHFVQRDDPGLVAEVINDLVAEVAD